MNGHKFLQAARRPKALHRAFSLSKRQVTVFGAIVEALVHPVIQAGRDLALRRAIRPKFVHCPAGYARRPMLPRPCKNSATPKSEKQMNGCRRSGIWMDDMNDKEKRPEILGMIETVLRAENPDLPNLWLFGQAHFSAEDRMAFIEVYGCDENLHRRRSIRARASDMLALLGSTVELETGCDVFEISPIRPRSAHEILKTIDAYNRLVSDRSE